MGDELETTTINSRITNLDNFLKLKPTKAPIAWDTYYFDEVKNFPNLGLKIEEPFVVIDIDDMVQAEKLTELINKEKIKCRIMQTTKGRHFWFKTTEPLKNQIKSNTAIGLSVDYRSWGKQSQVAIKLNGVWREWIKNDPWDQLEELPKWLRPLRQNRWKFCGMGEGDGRNQALYEYQIDLAKRDFNYNEAIEILRLINNYIFDEPLPKSELKLLSREEAYPDVENQELMTPWFEVNEKGQNVFKHNIMGEYLMKEMKIVSYKKQIYIYKDGTYVIGESEILKKIIELYPTSKITARNEVMDWIRINSYIREPEKHEYIINLKNGRLDLKNMKLLSHSSEVIDFQQVNASYDPKIYHESVDKMIQKVFRYDRALINLFEEMLGYILIKNNRFQKLFILFGEGSNGKSTILRLIRHFTGLNNYSTLSIKDLEDKFKTAELEHKIVNIGDDIPHTHIKDSSKLKSLSRGEAVTVERKNKDPFTLINYAKLIFSTNKIPHVSDKSHGFYRTLILVPLNAVFSAQDEDFNPNIDDEVTTDKALSYVLNIAIRGYKRLMKQGKFTESEKVKKALELYQMENTYPLQWVLDTEISVEELQNKPINDHFTEFKIWCEQNNIKNIPEQRNFSRDICKKFDFESVPKRSENGKLKRHFIK
ncbi:phage/plasmid primase, P4 family [Selenomonadales bacterium OttesenSCG-928-I06]|nr:phage/plasmid primase, P4 family [Selenomonadales bacterium OttesenSCG-928-I06]